MKHFFIFVGAVLAGFIVVATMEGLAYLFFPLPEGVDPMNTASLEEHMDMVPTGALITVILAHFLGTFTATWIAGRYTQNTIYAYLAATLFLLATVINLFLLPHPVWFAIVDVCAVLFGLILGTTAANYEPPSKNKRNVA